MGRDFVRATWSNRFEQLSARGTEEVALLQGLFVDESLQVLELSELLVELDVGGRLAVRGDSELEEVDALHALDHFVVELYPDEGSVRVFVGRTPSE